jgi:hypothetical protein
MADHVNNATGYAFPAAGRLAKQMHISPKTVRRSLTNLLRYGYLKVGPRMYKSVTYVLTLNHRPVTVDVHAKDNFGHERSQSSASEEGKADHQTYIKPTYKTYEGGSETIEANIRKLCSPFLGRSNPLLNSPHRLRYEPELRDRLGEDADAVIAALPEQCIEQLLQLVKRGTLMTTDVWLTRQIADQIRTERAA